MINNASEEAQFRVSKNRRSAKIKTAERPALVVPDGELTEPEKESNPAEDLAVTIMIGAGSCVARKGNAQR